VARTLRKTEILRGYRAYTAVISGGRMIEARPVRLYTLVDPDGIPGAVVGFAVARGIRGAVRRNRIKRLLRESYRLQKDVLLNALSSAPRSLRCVLMFVGPAPAHAGDVRLGTVQAPVGEVLERSARAVKSRS
jgi:ribonuclease P protein component